jgi:hypothetical protein
MSKTMQRSVFSQLADQREQGCGEEHQGRYLPCAVCRTQTQAATLSQYGARCFSCWETYRTGPLPKTPDVGDKKNSGPRDWIRALRRRDEAGERLTPAQRGAWREASHHGAFFDEVEVAQ